MNQQESRRREETRRKQIGSSLLTLTVPVRPIMAIVQMHVKDERIVGDQKERAKSRGKRESALPERLPG